MVLDHFFNFTKKYNLIGRVKNDFTQFCDNFTVAYFFEPPSRFVAILAIREAL